MGKDKVGVGAVVLQRLADGLLDQLGRVLLMQLQHPDKLAHAATAGLALLQFGQ